MSTSTQTKKQKKIKMKETPPDLFNMLNKVNDILRSNPQMAEKVSKCVTTIMENKEIMGTLSEQIKNTVENDDNVTNVEECVASIMCN